MSNKLYFRCRRFVDLDERGNEIEDSNNYGYSMYDNNEETISIGMSKEEVKSLLSPTREMILDMIHDNEERVCDSFLQSMENGLCVNGKWIER